MEMVWFYQDSSGASHGPVASGTIVTKLKQSGSFNENWFVWKAGWDKWMPCKETTDFKEIVGFINAPWYYLGDNGKQEGPLPFSTLAKKFDEGSIDGLTVVFSHELGEWKALLNVSLLKELLVDEATSVETPVAVFESAEDVEMHTRTKDYESFVKSSAVSIQTSEHSGDGGEGKRSFVSNDGTRYCWDEQEGEWVVDDFISEAENEKNVDDENEEEDGENELEYEEKQETPLKEDSEQSQTQKRKRPKKKKQKKAPNNWVYVTGLPSDVTVEEVKAHFSKVGLIAISPADQLPKIKIYRSEDGSCKGDCSLCYNSESSVKLAIDILNGGYLRPGAQVTVTNATFPSNESSNTRSDSLGKRPKLSHAQVKVAQSAMKQALSWNEDDDIGVKKSQALKIVVLEGMFRPSDFDDPKFSDELEQDVASECSKCGPIDKITVFSSNPKGIVIVKFHTAYGAQECVKLMDARFFGGSKIRCYFWDGVTNYTAKPLVEKQEAEESARLDEFGDWLETSQEELPEEFRLRVEG